jgi:hypothetical protein
MASTVIKRCTCKNEFQDERYGKGLRVHNVKKEGNKATCTVCRMERGLDKRA